MNVNELDWVPSRYGAADRIGAANNISAETILKAARLVRSGETLCLGVAVGPDTPAFPPRSCQLVLTQSSGAPRSTRGRNELCGNDDLLIASCGIGTHIDGLGHIGIGNVYYNGLRAEEILRRDGLLQLGTDAIPPLVGRGIVLDIAALSGAPFLDAGRAINSAEIEAACRTQGLAVESGDIVLLHTGWFDAMAQRGTAYIEQSPGLGLDGARYLAEREVVAVGADNAALEVIPFEDETLAYPVHQWLLPRNGIYILENIHTRPLIERAVHQFLFVLGVPRFRGGVQMAANPVAIF